MTDNLAQAREAWRAPTACSPTKASSTLRTWMTMPISAFVAIVLLGDVEARSAVERMLPKA
jgi:hypothetical protein